MSLDAHHNIYIHCAHAEGDVPDKTGYDATEQNAAVPEAPAHVVDRYGTSIDNAGHIFERDRLTHHRKHASPPPVQWTAARHGDHVDGRNGARPS